MTVSGTTRFRRGRRSRQPHFFLRVWALWDRCVRWVRTATQKVRESVSPAGWLVVAMVVVGFAVGLPNGWVELVAAAVVGSVLLVLSIPFLFGKKTHQLQLTLERERVVAGNDISGEIQVYNTGKSLTLPRSIDVPIGQGLLEVSVPLLRPGTHYAENLLLPASKRGIIQVGPPSALRGDPLGIVAREQSWEDKFTVYVHPQTTALPSTSTGLIRDLEGNPATLLVNDDLSFHAIREYAPGDSQRQIHWKSTAKMDTLMVRQYEDTRRSQMLIALATQEEEYASDDEFELAVSAAASIGIRGIRDGRDLQVVVGGQLPQFAPPGTRSIRELTTRSTRTLLDDFAGIDMSDRVNPLSDVIDMAVSQETGVSIAVLVAGSAMTVKEMRTAALAFPPPISVLVVACDPQREPSFRKLADLNVVTVGLLDDLRHLMMRRAQQ